MDEATRKARREGGCSMRTRKYLGYTIEPSGDNYRVRRPDGSYMESGIAASIGTAKRWIRIEIYALKGRKTA